MLLLSCCVRKVDQLVFAPDGGILYTAGMRVTDSINCIIPSLDNRGFEIWQPTQSDKRVTHLFPDDQVNGLVPLPIGGRLVVNLDMIRVNRGTRGRGWYDQFTRKSGRYSEEYTHIPALAAGSNLLVAFGSKTGDYRHYSLFGWRSDPFESPAAWQVAADVVGHRVVRAAVTDDGTRLVCYETHGGSMLVHQGHTLAERSVTDGSLVRRVPLPVRKLTALAFSSDNRWLAAACGAAVYVWETANLVAKPIKLFDSGRMAVTGIAFHPSGRLLAATSNDSNVRLYCTTSWQTVHTFAWEVGRLRSIAFSPCGLLAAAGSDTGKVVVWDVNL